MDDDSWIARSVLGATLSVSLGLFTVALCHYLGVARLMLALSSTEPSSYTWMYPALDWTRQDYRLGLWMLYGRLPLDEGGSITINVCDVLGQWNRDDGN